MLLLATEVLVIKLKGEVVELLIEVGDIAQYQHILEIVLKQGQVGSIDELVIVFVQAHLGEDHLVLCHPYVLEQSRQVEVLDQGFELGHGLRVIA